jgi:hypothetical protein
MMPLNFFRLPIPIPILALGLALASLAFACSDSAEPVDARTVPVDSDEGEAAKATYEEPASGDDEFVVTAGNVYDHEIYWPNIVALVDGWQPVGAEQPLQARYRGALIRVERDGRVRIDFGRHGRHEVPIEKTDLVRSANEVRLGKRHKAAPNFVLQVGTRLVDPSTDEGIPMKSTEIARARVFLCIFADPMDEDFPTLARDLASLADVDGLGVVLFPQSGASEDLQKIKELLRASDWEVPFGYPRLSENYTLSLLGERPRGPYALVLTPEGRVLYRSELGKIDALAEIRGSLES